MTLVQRRRAAAWAREAGVAEAAADVLNDPRELRQKDRLEALERRKVVLLERRVARVEAAEEAAKPPPEKKPTREEKQAKIAEYFKLTMPEQPAPEKDESSRAVPLRAPIPARPEFRPNLDWNGVRLKPERCSRGLE